MLRREKRAFVDADVPDEIVVGSGWIGWNSLDKQAPLHLGTVAKIMAKAISAKS